MDEIDDKGHLGQLGKKMGPKSTEFDPFGLHSESSFHNTLELPATIDMAQVDVGAESPKGQKMDHPAFTVVAFVFVLCLVPFILPFMLIFRIYRHALRDVIHKKEGDKVLMVSGDDSVWLQDSPENRAIINSLMLVRGKPDIDKFCNTVYQRLVEAKDPNDPNSKLFPKITKYATKILHRYVWYEDPNFDMKFHVYLHPEPAPRTKADLERMVGEICSTPMPIHKPAWQFILIAPAEDHPDYGKLHYGIFRAHHSIADGVSLIRMMMQNLVDETPKPIKGQSQRFGSKKIMQMFVRAVLEGPSLLLQRIILPRDNNILHGPELSGTKLVSWSDPIDLNLIKQIKSTTGTTINDVIISCLASTFRDYFKVNASKIPENILSYIPVDIRPSSEAITLDNQFALVFLNLPLDEDDPLKTLKKTKMRMDKIKNSPEPIVNAYTIKYCMNRLPNWLTQMFFDWVSGKSTLIVSNVPGPQEVVSIGGQELDAMIFWPPQKTDVGLGVSVFTYRDTLRVGIYVDKNIMSNPRRLVDGFTRNVDKLTDAIKDQATKI